MAILLASFAKCIAFSAFSAFGFNAKRAKNPQSTPRGNYTLRVLCESHCVLCVYCIPLDI
jgi:hypothetical protein